MTQKKKITIKRSDISAILKPKKKSFDIEEISQWAKRVKNAVERDERHFYGHFQTA